MRKKKTIQDMPKAPKTGPDMADMTIGLGRRVLDLEEENRKLRETNHHFLDLLREIWEMKPEDYHRQVGISWMARVNNILTYGYDTK